MRPSTRNRQVIMTTRPEGAPTREHFDVVEAPMPEPRDGEVLFRVLYLSLDPYERILMREKVPYLRSVAVGGVMVGETVGEVVESRAPGFEPGELVIGYGDWQEYASLNAAALKKIDRSFFEGVAPVSTALGVLGMPGLTAYAGMLEIGQPKAGETVVVSAAAGAVGSAAGQIAKIRGARVVGIAGGPEKCRHVVEDLGFDACVDRRAPNLAEELARACPQGIDVYFENVGGPVVEAVWPLLNLHARVPVCGVITQYDDTAPVKSLDLGSILFKRATVRGFLVSDFRHRTPEFKRDVSTWIREGRLRYREDVVHGLEKAPDAFLAMLAGRNVGKALVHVSDPSREA